MQSQILNLKSQISVLLRVLCVCDGENLNFPCALFKKEADDEQKS